MIESFQYDLMNTEVAHELPHSYKASRKRWDKYPDRRTTK